METVKGNLLDLFEQGEFTCIIHQCNCFHTFGAGIAKQIKQRYPEAYEIDKQTKYADKNKLGTFSCYKNKHGYIVNLYSQFHYGKGLHTDYEALDKGFEKIASYFPNEKIGYPLIGCGHGGGDWKIIEKIIDEKLKGLNHKLVIF